MKWRQLFLPWWIVWGSNRAYVKQLDCAGHWSVNYALNHFLKYFHELYSFDSSWDIYWSRLFDNEAMFLRYQDQNWASRGFSGSPVVRNFPFPVLPLQGVVGSIPGQGTKISSAVWRGQKWNKINWWHYFKNMIGQSNLKKLNKRYRFLKDLTENQFIQTSLRSSHPPPFPPSIPPSIPLPIPSFFLPLMLAEIYLTLCAML